jgi:hypothetical protein
MAVYYQQRSLPWVVSEMVSQSRERRQFYQTRGPEGLAYRNAHFSTCEHPCELRLRTQALRLLESFCGSILCLLALPHLLLVILKSEE